MERDDSRDSAKELMAALKLLYREAGRCIAVGEWQREALNRVGAALTDAHAALADYCDARERMEGKAKQSAAQTG